ncbi:super-infection exclusion protein B [Enterobacter hormaechei subsp. xiangfangensis]|nr:MULTISPECIES: super-infection exclusion protein B [Enterobacter]MCC2920073.1 superinfection exclusion B family protein [Enterobacter hormaechei]MCU3460980.1 superinfection exclusion B family protein [Enterobacter hormaechei subsp. xiangfangensis]MCU3466361.1 superinfection exclusion B family protein [Enterobacter hormaechei subsp. xiangfangensis]UDV44742.1 superinfection exclusion B family protein [Enterobacter hormaechei]
MLIILIFLIIVMPVSAKEWINLHNPEILPKHWMYYILLFCFSYVLNGIVNYAFNAARARAQVFNEQQRKVQEEKFVRELFDSLSLGERAYLAFAVDFNNRIQVEKGSPESISLLGNPTLRYPAAARGDTKYGFTAAIPNIQLNIWNGDTVQLPSRYLIATVEELDSQLWTVNSIKPNTDNTVSLTVAEYSDAIYQ